ncbi:MAG: hypothetical protein IPK16_22395 [Anaerolineales bacterium]|nr:hypothetical protein [Anaerolineales bacterium]
MQVRIGANSLAIYANGQQLPSVSWDKDSLANVKMLAGAVPALAGLDLGQLTSVGSGFTLNIEPAAGKAKLNIPKWTGETTFATEQPAADAKPLVLDFLAIDDSGKIATSGLDLDALAPLLGGAALAVPPDLLATLKSLGAEDLSIKTTPNGITLSLDGKPLPSLSYDSAALAALSPLLGPLSGMAGDQLAMVQDQLTKLPGLDATIDVNLTGQPKGGELPQLDVKLTDTGGVNLLGLDIPGVTLPADTIKQLEDAGIQNLALNVKGDSILANINGQALPKINLSPEGMKVLVGLASGAAAGLPAGAIEAALGSIKGDGLKLTLALPGTPGEVATPTEPTLTPPDLGDLSAPTFKLEAVVKDGQITSVGGLSADQLKALGVELPALPPNINDILKSLNASSLDIVTEANVLKILVNGAEAMNMQYDAASLAALWNLAKPNLAGSPVADPALQKLIEEQILPLLPGSNIAVKITVE